MKNTETALSLLPSGMREECERVLRFRLDYPEGLSEIRLRAGGRSALVMSGENLPLCYNVSAGELADVVARLCGGALYAYRDTIKEGYIPMEGGGRVGICGHARYDGERCVGISEITSIAIRIPHACREFADGVYRRFLARPSGILIYSPPGGGKTTALRSLARMIASGKEARRVVVIDERCEFNFEDYASSQVDILRGYRRSDGVEIALRTLMPEVIMLDEIGSAAEADALLEFSRCGALLIATAHANGIEDVLRREGLCRLVRSGAFGAFYKIRKNVQGEFLIDEEGECLDAQISGGGDGSRNCLFRVE